MTMGLLEDKLAEENKGEKMVKLRNNSPLVEFLLKDTFDGQKQ